jgi:hypothetical protein
LTEADDATALIAAAQPKEEEDFSWDDAEVDEKETPKMPSAPTPEPVKLPNDGQTAKVEPAVASPAAATVESASTSRRQSEESYDIVSEQSGGNGAKKPVSESKREDTDGDDSDWE